MYGCDLLYRPEVAEQVRAELRRAMGSCPCDNGRRCPLLPADLTGIVGKELAKRQPLGNAS